MHVAKSQGTSKRRPILKLVAAVGLRPGPMGMMQVLCESLTTKALPSRLKGSDATATAPDTAGPDQACMTSVCIAATTLHAYNSVRHYLQPAMQLGRGAAQLKRCCSGAAALGFGEGLVAATVGDWKASIKVAVRTADRASILFCRVRVVSCVHT